MTDMTFEFDSRETYVAYVKSWRIRYAEQTLLIRKLRNQMLQSSGDAAAGYQSQLHYARQDAHQMMLTRNQATKYKNAQLAALAVAEAA